MPPPNYNFLNGLRFGLFAIVILLQFSSCTQDDTEVISTDEMQLIQTFVDLDMAGKTTFDNLPLEADWENARIGAETVEVPLINPVRSFESNLDNFQTRLVIPKADATQYRLISLESNFDHGEYLFTDLIAEERADSWVRWMQMDRDLGSLEVKSYRTLSDPNANMPLDCTTVSYFERTCYYSGWSQVYCSDWEEVSSYQVCTGEGGGGGGGSSNYRVLGIDKSGLSPCHQDLIEDIIGGTQTEIKKIFSMFTEEVNTAVPYNLRFQYGSSSSGTAWTEPNLANNFAIINIDPAKVVGNTDISFARTILHETLHAYLLYEADYPTDCDLDDLLDDYIEKHSPDPNAIHHNLFVETKFLNDISTELKSYAASAGYNVTAMGDQYFKDLAWGGLMDTNVFNSLSPVDQQRIVNTIGAEYYNTNYNGIGPLGTLACQ